MWLVSVRPAYFIAAQPPNRRQAANRYMHKRFLDAFPHYSFQHHFSEILAEHDQWRQARDQAKQHSFDLLIFARALMYNADVIMTIAGYLQPDSDEWSTGSVTHTWHHF